MKITKCLVCSNNKLIKYLDLGNQPLANNLSKKIDVKKYPLQIVFCKNCYHNQLSHEVKKEKLFSNYFYLSSQSETLQKHFDNSAKKYIKLFNLNKKSSIIDVGSNDGISLKYYKKKILKIYSVLNPLPTFQKWPTKMVLKQLIHF